jgi:hypothetical protein
LGLGPKLYDFLSAKFVNVRNKLVFVPDRPSQRSLMFVSKDGAYPNEAPGCSTLGQAPGLTHKQSTSLERPTRDKHSSFSRTFENYGRKKFYNIGTRDPLAVKVGQLVDKYKVLERKIS